MANFLGFLGTLDERFNIAAPGGRSAYSPGELDFGSNINGNELVGELGEGARAFGALWAQPYTQDVDYDVFNLGPLDPGTYVLELERYNWGRFINEAVSGHDINVTVYGPGLSPWGEGPGTFTVTEPGSFWLRVSGVPGGSNQYTVVYYEQGTQPANTPADWLLILSPQSLLPEQTIFPRFPSVQDADGREPGTLETEWFIDGQSIGFRETFTPTFQHLGATITVRYRFLDGQNSYEVSDFYTLGTVERLNSEAFFSIPFAYKTPFTGTVFETDGITVQDDDGGTVNPNFRFFWYLDGQLVSTEPTFAIEDSMMGKLLEFGVNFNDGNGFLEETNIYLSEITAELPNNDFFLPFSQSTDLRQYPDFYNFSLSGFGDIYGYGNSLPNTIIGNPGANVIRGLEGYDILRGGVGNDTLSGGEGNDTLEGGDGDDTLDGGAGGDTFDGGAGRDTVTYESATRSVRVDLQNSAFMFNDAVGDTFTSIEVFQTGNTIDQLRGDSGANEFYTGGLSDRLYGRAGDDLLFGETGADAFYGGVGADTMTAGDDAGRRDRFIFFNMVESGVGEGNRDVITDFVSGEDRIEISRFDADITQGFKLRFDFIADAAFSNTAGELRYEQTGGITIVQADVNGDSAADFEIELTGTINLQLGDFLL